ncbi:OLC1v1012461C1 [Oldenlandia corymbosa var. corymbosa]|uniref:OLC1v1012461C1 n=1 Tax=Oldenlandia corymbosa var. corymbosa TaxID=529605 RepID=A0AAV1DWN4_OLDCO|nr:OLC1v1012461C1 [Oldenlandia corymbosa var. corymbosa]
MELSHSSFLLLLSLIIPALVALVFKLTMTKKMGSDLKKQRVLPGTTGWPILGETLDYYWKLGSGNLEKFVADRVAKYSSKVFKTSLLGDPMVVLCSPEGNKFLFANELKHVKFWWPGTLNKIFPKTDKKPSHDHSNKLRNLLQVIFKSDVLRTYVGTIDRLTKRHLESHWDSKQEVVVGHMVTKLLFTLACNIFYGIDDPQKIEMFAKGMKNIESGVIRLPFDFPGTAFRRAIKSSKALLKEVEAIMEQRKIELSDSGRRPLLKDFMSYLMMERDENGEPFKDEDISSHLLGLLLASSTSMHSTMTNVIKCLSEFPDVYASVLEEQNDILAGKGQDELLCWEDLRKMKYSWNVVSEVLRIFTPNTGSFREAITDFNFQGYTIPKGSKIHWMSYATHKDPNYFPEPKKFDPSRFQENRFIAPFTFVPFGGGPRMCPGIEYARLVILVFMHNVVTKFRWEKKIAHEEMVYYPAPKPVNELPVLLRPRH